MFNSPLARILEHDTAYWSCLTELEARAGWILFHNPRFAPRIDPNHAGAFRAPTQDGAAIVRAIIDFYRARGVTPAAFVDVLAAPADLIPCLLQAGFCAWDGANADLMLYVGPDTANAAPDPSAIVRTPEAMDEWAAIMDEEAARDEGQRALLHSLYRTQISDPRMTAYLIRVDGVAVCRCELFSCAGLGRVEAVRTQVAFRRRGLAAAVIRAAVADSLARGNQLTYIYAEPGAEPQRLYQRLGFRTVAHNVIRGFILNSGS